MSCSWVYNTRRCVVNQLWVLCALKKSSGSLLGLPARLSAPLACVELFLTCRRCDEAGALFLMLALALVVPLTCRSPSVTVTLCNFCVRGGEIGPISSVSREPSLARLWSVRLWSSVSSPELLSCSVELLVLLVRF